MTADAGRSRAVLPVGRVPFAGSGLGRGPFLLAMDMADLDALLVAVAADDLDAFRRLYELAAPKLLGTILRMLKSRPAAEEVLQDVFLRIWQSARNFSPASGSAGTWMNAIARNRAIDVLRQGRSMPLVSTALAGEDGEIDWFARIAEDRDRERDMINAASLRHCLATLDPQARSCVLLAYYEGYSREEIARRYDRPVNTIKTWLHRSLLTLRSCLDEVAA